MPQRFLPLPLTAVLAVAALATLPTPAAAAGDPVAGKAVFARCAVCHSVNAGENRVGPSLHGVVGRKAGTEAGFNYSPAMKTSGLTWTPGELDSYLTSPAKKLPGIKMIFAGLPNPTDRANLIAYLGTLK
jgi:cytochrome c